MGKDIKYIGIRANIFSVETFITTENSSDDTQPGASFLIDSKGFRKSISIPRLRGKAFSLLVTPWGNFPQYQQTALYDRTLIRAKHPNTLEVYEISRVANEDESLPARFIENICLKLEQQFINWHPASIHSLVISENYIIVGTNGSFGFWGSVVVFNRQNRTQLSKKLFEGSVQITGIVGNIFYAICDEAIVQGKIQEGKIEIIRGKLKINQWPWLVPTGQHNEVMYAYAAKDNDSPQGTKLASNQVIYVYTMASDKCEERYIRWSSDFMFFFPDRAPGSLLTYYLGKER